MSDITNDILSNQREILIDKKVEQLLKDNPKLIIDNEILEYEYNVDGTKKDLYTLSSERDIKETQLKMKINEYDYKLNQSLISKEEYDMKKRELDDEINDIKLIYNDLIFNIINNNEIEIIKSSIIKYNLNNIDLKRLKDAIINVTEFKVDEFIKNNKEFKDNTLSYWNYKYNELSKAISKSREVESFILNLIN